MTTRQWRRSAILFANDREIEGLRIRFKVRKTLRPDPNSLDLHAYNLGANTRSTFDAARIPIVLLAGYEKSRSVIFSGISRAVDHVREGQDWRTRIHAGDGDRAFRSFSAFSFGPGTPVAKVLERIAWDLGIDVGDAIAKLRRGDFRGAVDKTFLQGYAATGRSVKELDRVAKAIGLEWSIQDGSLQLLEPDASTQAETVVLAADSGLIGSPEHKMPDQAGAAPLLVARCLLNGQILPGQIVSLETSSRAGLYRVESVEHAGDTHGSEWTTTWEGRPR